MALDHQILEIVVDLHRREVRRRALRKMKVATKFEPKGSGHVFKHGSEKSRGKTCPFTAYPFSIPRKLHHEGHEGHEEQKDQ